MASQATNVVDVLEKSRAEFIDALSGLTEEQARAAPDVARWSVLQCIEHVVTVEGLFLNRLSTAGKQESCNISADKESQLAARLVNRETRVKAPEHARPNGKYANLAEAIEQFERSRGDIVRFAQERAADLYFLELEHPRFGRLNGVELLVVIAGHSRRHAEQIREIRQATRP